MTLIECGNCGIDNRPNRRFCRECGHPLVLECPGCGAHNEPGDRFCGSCGLELGNQHPAAPADDAVPLTRDPNERRFVAVLFADLVDFTNFSEERDHEVVRAALTDYYDRAREIVERFGGSVQKFIGDAVMAVWGATVAHEDDAERAVRAGLELVEMVAHLGEEIEGAELKLRVGVLTGEASVGPATQELGLVIGDLVNTASRLQTNAEPGTVVVGESTYHMLRDTVEFESLGERSVKGKAEPVAMWRAVRVALDRTRRTPSCAREPAFVGRGEEIRLLKDAIHATERTGRARLVSVIGEAGIGKTRLAGELRKYVGGIVDDVYWHEGRSPAYDQGLPFWALGEMVRQRAGIAETDDALRSRTKLRTAVAEYVESFSEQEWIEPRLAALLGLETAATGEQVEFFAAVRGFFQRIAQRGTTVLVFEDFHWADAGLVEFVAQLVERSAGHPIVVLTLARPDLLDREPGWGSGRRNFAAMHLGPLTDEEMGQLVTGMVPGMVQDVVAEITARANGIPLYAVELVRMLVADGDLVAADRCCVPATDLSTIRVPDTVRAVVGARLDRLPREQRSLIQDAAVLGAAFTPGGLAAMSGLERSRLEEALEPLVHREVLELESDPRSPERGQYRFVQSMIREVAYRRLTREERRIRHIRAAEYFAQLEEIEFAGAVAAHYMSAHGFADAPHAPALAAEATTALTDAAQRAAGLHSHAQALAMVEQALTLVTDPMMEAELWQKAARSAGALARHEVAIDYAQRALAWYQQHGDADAVAEAAARVGSHMCHAFRAAEAVALLEPIVAAEPALSSPPIVGAAAELARAYLMILHTEDSADLADRVMGPAERFAMIPTVINSLITRGTALGDMGRLHEAVALLRGATAYAQEHGLVLPELRAANNLGHLLAYDDHVGALEACRRGMEQANRIGDVRFIASFSWAVAAYLDRDGRSEEALAIRDDVRSRLELHEQNMVWYELTDLMVRVEHGESSLVGKTQDALERSLDESNPQSRAGVAHARARLHLLTGEIESAYDAAMNVDDDLLLPDNLAVATVAAALLGDTDRLETVAAALEERQARGRMVGAMRWAATAAIAALHGDIDAAVAGFGKALEFSFLRLDRAALQGLFATLVGRDVPEARKASDEAYAILSEIGATAYIDLYAAGMPPAAERQAAGS